MLAKIKESQIGIKKSIVLAIIILIGFNLYFLYINTRMKTENQMLKSRIAFSIEEQLSLYEYRLQGLNLEEEVNRIINKVKMKKTSIDKNNYLLIYIFREISCDRCILNEIKIFNEHKDILNRFKIIPIMIFSQIDEGTYFKIIKSLKIENISLREESHELVNKFLDLKNPLLLFIGRNKDVIIASISDYYRDKYKSHRFYKNVEKVIENIKEAI